MRTLPLSGQNLVVITNYTAGQNCEFEPMQGTSIIAVSGGPPSWNHPVQGLVWDCDSSSLHVCNNCNGCIYLPEIKTQRDDFIVKGTAIDHNKMRCEQTRPPSALASIILCGWIMDVFIRMGQLVHHMDLWIKLCMLLLFVGLFNESYLSRHVFTFILIKLRNMVLPAKYITKSMCSL